MSPSATDSPRLVSPDDIADAIRYAAEDNQHEGCPLDEMAAAVMILVDQAIYDIDPVGVAEISERTGAERNTIDKWRNRGVGFPKPRWQVGRRPAWRWADIEAWGRATGRLRDSGQWAKPGTMVKP